MSGTSRRYTEWVTDLKLPSQFHSLQFRLTAGFAIVLASSLFLVSGWSALSTRAAIAEYEENVERFRATKTSELVQDVYSLNEDFRTVQTSLEQIGRILPGRVLIIGPNNEVMADSYGWRGIPDRTGFGANGKWNGPPASMSMEFALEDEFKVKALFFASRERNRGGIFDAFELFKTDGGNRHQEELARLEEQFVAELVESEPSAQRFMTDDHFTEFANRGQARQAPSIRFADSADGSLPLIASNGVSAATEIVDRAVGELAVEPQLAALEESFQRSIVIAGGAGLVAGVLLVALFARGALSPVRSLSQAAHRLGGGDFEQRVSDERRDELGDLARTFNSMAGDLQTAESNRRRMTADIAHELRNPLTNIRGYLEAIKDGVVEPDDAAIDTLHSETVHLARLVEDLQLLAVADAGELRLHRTPTYVSKIADAAVSAATPRALEAGIGIALDVAVDDEPLVDADPTRFTQVIGNLLDNAIVHAANASEVKVTIAARTDQGRRTVLMQVTNTGDGIAEEDLARVFDQFYRVDPSRTRSSGGAGLGLTIVKRIVEAHGGTVTATSSDGVTTFSVAIPESTQAE